MLSLAQCGYQGFGSPKEIDKQKVTIELMKMQVFKERSDSAEKIMEHIASTLAGAGVSFKLKKCYTIEFANDKLEHEELKKKAESFVEFFGGDSIVFEN